LPAKIYWNRRPSGGKIEGRKEHMKTLTLAAVLAIAVFAQDAPKPPMGETIKLDDKQARTYLTANRDVLAAQQVQQAWEQRLRAELAKIKEYTDATEKLQKGVAVMNSVVNDAKTEHKCPTCDFDADALALVKPTVPEAKESAKVKP
jgi:hypothetical protein